MANFFTKEISVTSRASVKIKDSFYTVEYSETQYVDDPENVTFDELCNARSDLWDTAHNEVDIQIEDIIKASNHR